MLEGDARRDRTQHDVPLAKKFAPCEPQARALLVELQPVAMCERACGIGRGAEQSAVHGRGMLRRERRSRAVRDLHAQRSESIAERLAAIGDLALHGRDRIVRPQRDSILAQRPSHFRQLDARCVIQSSGPDEQAQSDVEILGTARERSCDSEVNIRDGRRQQRVGRWRRCRTSACARTRRCSARGCGSSRRCRCRLRAKSVPPPARPPRRRTIRPACAWGPRDCW